VLRLLCGYIITFPEDSILHEIGFAVADSSKASGFHPLPLLKHIIEDSEMAGWCSVFCKPAATFFNYFPYLLWNSIFYSPPNIQAVFCKNK
jgi:hypothetical protein